MKAIRWGGLVSFVIVMSVLVAGVLLFAESIAKNILESQLTELNNAKVDIGKVSINYSSFSVSVANVQVTDPEQPMQNMFEVGNASFAISFADLFFKKVIINDMSLTGVELATSRKVSGEIAKQVEIVEIEKEGAGFDFPEIDLPDVSDILKNEPLTADKLIPELTADYKATQENWKNIKDDINDKQRWDGYDERYNQLQQDIKGDYKKKLASIKSAKRLSKDLKSEGEKIKQARKTFNMDVDRLNKEFDAAKKSPRDDIRRIKEKYKLDNLDAGNITQLLFGSQTAEWLKLAQVWYARLEPYLEDEDEDEEEAEAVEVERVVGEDVRFNEFDPKPDLYIKKASVDAVTPRGKFAGVITQVSSDQSINKKPMRLNLKGIDLKGRDNEIVDAEFNYINIDKGSSHVKYVMSNYQLENYQVSKSDSLPLSIDKSLMDVEIDVRLQKSVLTGYASLDFTDVAFSSKKTAKGSSFSRMLSSSFSDVHDFYIKTRFTGGIDDLQFKLRSDLDNRVGDQLKEKFREKKQSFERELRAKIYEKIKEPMAEIEAKKKQLNKIKEDVDSKEKEIKQKLAFLKEQIKSEADLKKQELKSKADKKLDKKKGKLKNKLKGLFK
jgi:uncharacterized protein (TIGR03545 family)